SDKGIVIRMIAGVNELIFYAYWTPEPTSGSIDMIRRIWRSDNIFQLRCFIESKFGLFSIGFLRSLTLHL
ncbi:MAG: hypothetical protein ACJ70Q_07465, partial [Nitrososphaera sp.]